MSLLKGELRPASLETGPDLSIGSSSGPKELMTSMFISIKCRWTHRTFIPLCRSTAWYNEDDLDAAPVVPVVVEVLAQKHTRVASGPRGPEVESLARAKACVVRDEVASQVKGNRGLVEAGLRASVSALERRCGELERRKEELETLSELGRELLRNPAHALLQEVVDLELGLAWARRKLEEECRSEADGPSLGSDLRVKRSMCPRTSRTSSLSPWRGSCPASQWVGSARRAMTQRQASRRRRIGARRRRAPRCLWRRSPPTRRKASSGRHTCSGVGPLLFHPLLRRTEVVWAATDCGRGGPRLVFWRMTVCGAWRYSWLFRAPAAPDASVGSGRR